MGDNRKRARGRRGAYLFGHWAERLAALYLWSKGYRILARRFRTGRGEIDLIAYRRGLTVFVEVKARGSLENAAFSVTDRQKARIVAAAQEWQRNGPARGGLDAQYRFDVILLAPWRWPQHIENAFGCE